MNTRYDPMICTGCAQEFAFPSAARSYTDLPQAGGHTGAHFSDMLLVPVWCHACEGASWVERIPGSREFGAATGLRRRSRSIGQEGIDDELLNIDGADLRWLYEHLVHRTAPSRCLVCASTRFTPIVPTQRATPVVHDACWGSPIAFRRSWTYCTRRWSDRDPGVRFFHDATGALLWTRFGASDFCHYQLAIILHVRRADPRHAALADAIVLAVEGAGEQAMAALAPLVSEHIPAALGFLGALHYVGQGVPHSGTVATGLLEQAKRLGDACAAHNLASLYSTGAPGIAKNIPRARQLFTDARAMGGQYEPDDFYLGDDFTVASKTFYKPG